MICGLDLCDIKYDENHFLDLESREIDFFND